MSKQNNPLTRMRTTISSEAIKILRKSYGKQKVEGESAK